MDRGKQGRKRSLLTDAAGIPLHLVAAGANRPDRTLLPQTLAGLEKVGLAPEGLPVHLDQGYLGAPVRAVLAEHGGVEGIATKGLPEVGEPNPRWVVERTHSWLNDVGRLRRCPERRGEVVDVSLFLAATIIVIRQLLRAAFHPFRWPTRSTIRRVQ